MIRGATVQRALKLEGQCPTKSDGMNPPGSCWGWDESALLLFQNNNINKGAEWDWATCYGENPLMAQQHFGLRAGGAMAEVEMAPSSSQIVLNPSAWSHGSLRDIVTKRDPEDLQATIGLNLGARTYFSSSAPGNSFCRRPRLNNSAGSAQIPRCQAEGCKANLTNAKHYHRRHRVCELHSKASTVTAGGLIQRFCQQCSRFHVISEFDEGKRSCRKRLADHNRRRRKRPPAMVCETTHSSPGPAIGTGHDAQVAPHSSPVPFSFSAGLMDAWPKPGASSSEFAGSDLGAIPCSSGQALDHRQPQISSADLITGAPEWNVVGNMSQMLGFRSFRDVIPRAPNETEIEIETKRAA